jgi:hypothetical protein
MKKLLHALLVFSGLVSGSVVLTILWERNPEKFPQFPAPLAVWLSTTSNLPKDDLSILVGLTLSFLFLSLLTCVVWFTCKKLGKR